MTSLHNGKFPRLRGLFSSYLKECLIFLDDTLVFSQTFEEHLERLEAVFSRLKEHGLKLKPSKCEFFMTKVNYLGNGVETDPEKISALSSWPVPTNVKALRSFRLYTVFTLCSRRSRRPRFRKP